MSHINCLLVVWELHYIGRDYLGSITHIADSEGNLVAEYSYDAWGRLRDPATQELYGNSGVSDLLLWRGFTGHEWLPWFGLYNMNARLYDPVLGRFLSPDPYVQMPDNTQNLNRYLYALNNPFQYKDDSGEFFLTMIVGALIGAGVSALTYSVGTLVSGADWDWKDFGKTIGIGAFSGALGKAMFWVLPDKITGTLAYNVIGKVARQTITNSIFSGFDLKSLHGIASSALVSSLFPSDKALGFDEFFPKKTGYNLLTGAVSDLTSGMAGSYAYGNTALIWQSVAKGAISNISQSLLDESLSGFSKKIEQLERTEFGKLSKFMNKQHPKSETETSNGDVNYEQVISQPNNVYGHLPYLLNLGLPKTRGVVDADSYSAEFRFVY